MSLARAVPISDSTPGLGTVRVRESVSGISDYPGIMNRRCISQRIPPLCRYSQGARPEQYRECRTGADAVRADRYRYVLFSRVFPVPAIPWL